MEFSDAGVKIRLFHDVSLRIDSGSSISIVGASGVGKTTLLYIIGGLETPTAGDVLYDDQSFQTLRRERNRFSQFRGENIGFVFQFHQLLPEFSALENVAMPLLLKGHNRDEAMGKAEHLLQRVGLAKRISHRPGALSGGEQQRVAVARAYISKPGVVLADEPTGNLDPKNGDQVTELLKQFQYEDGITLIVVTHSLELAMQMDRLIELTPNGIEERM